MKHDDYIFGFPKGHIRRKIELFLVGFPYGLYGKAIEVEEHGKGHYTWWDKIRYRLLVGEKLDANHAE